MTSVSVSELLLQEIQTLPEALSEEVFDFLLFIKARHAEENFLWQKVEEAQAYRGKHPEEVVTATGEEWDQATAHLGEK